LRPSREGKESERQNVVAKNVNEHVFNREDRRWFVGRGEKNNLNKQKTRRGERGEA